MKKEAEKSQKVVIRARGTGKRVTEFTTKEVLRKGKPISLSGVSKRTFVVESILLLADEKWDLEIQVRPPTPKELQGIGILTSHPTTCIIFEQESAPTAVVAAV